MINVLPLKLITEVDQPLYGANLLNLAKLERAGFKIPSGIAVSAPPILLDTVLKHTENLEREIFEQRLELIKKDFKKIPVPDGLEKFLKKEKSFLLNGQFYKNKNRLWETLLQIWLSEIRTKIWNNGFALGAASNLTPQAIFFFKKNFFPVTAYFDPDFKDVVIKSDTKLEPNILNKIDELVISANRKLFIPQIYQLAVIEKTIFIIGLTSFTQTLPLSKETDVIISKTDQKQLIKSAVKIFLNLSSGFAIENSADGILIDGEEIDDFDTTVFKLAESALSFYRKPIIYKLPDITDGEIRGTLRLINQKSLLDKSAGTFLFARNRKSLLNIELGIPFLKSIDEMVDLKKQLSERGINRKDTLKFWLEVCVPENIINIEDYIRGGLDGIILNLNELQKFLGGYSITEGEFYKKQTQTVIKFVNPLFKILHKSNIPILALGSLVLHPDILDFLLEEGVWGVVANNNIEVKSLPEHLHWAEKRMVIKRLG